MWTTILSLVTLALRVCAVEGSNAHGHDARSAVAGRRGVVVPRQAVPSYTLPPGPQQTGTVAGCSLWAVVNEGDTCATLSSAFGIPVSQFIAWNPAVSADCANNFWAGYSYCVRVGP